MLLDPDGDGWYAARAERQQLDWLRKKYPPDASNCSSKGWAAHDL